MAFKRGQDPKETLGIGLKGIFKQIGGLALDFRDDAEESVKAYAMNRDNIKIFFKKEKELAKYYDYSIIVAIYPTSFKILKSRFTADEDHIYPLEYLPEYARMLKDSWEKYKMLRSF